MNILPQALLTRTDVEVLLNDGENMVLKKELSTHMLDHEVYLAQPGISLIVKGSQRISGIDDISSSLIAQAGEGLVFPPGLYQIADFIPDQGSFQSYIVYFGKEVVTQFLGQFSRTILQQGDRTHPIKLSVSPEVFRWLDFTGEFFNDKQKLRITLAKGRTIELLHILLAATHNPENMLGLLANINLPPSRNIKHFMENNYHRALRVEHFAQLTGRSIRTFRRDFVATFRMKPTQWLRERRLGRAVELVEEKSYPVSQLAEMVGYLNTSYFIQEFKAYTGMSPKKYMLNRI